MMKKKRDSAAERERLYRRIRDDVHELEYELRADGCFHETVDATFTNNPSLQIESEQMAKMLGYPQALIYAWIAWQTKRNGWSHG